MRPLDDTDLNNLDRAARERDFAHPADVIRLVEEVRRLKCTVSALPADGVTLQGRVSTPTVVADTVTTFEETVRRLVESGVTFPTDPEAPPVDPDVVPVAGYVRGVGADENPNDVAYGVYDPCLQDGGQSTPPDRVWAGQQRFTDRLRRACVTANKESQLLNIEYIGVEQLILGVLRVGGVACAALRKLAVDVDRMVVRVKELTKPVPTTAVVMGRLPYTPRAKGVTDRAVRLARERGFEYVGTEHLLLAAASDGESPVAPVFADFGVTYDGLWGAVNDVLNRNVANTEAPQSSPKSDGADEPTIIDPKDR